MHLSLLLLAPLAHAAPGPWFYPDETDNKVFLEQDGTLPGVIVGRTGLLLLETAHPALIGALPGVESIRAHGLPDVYVVTPAAGVDDLALSQQLHDRPDVPWAHPDLLLDLVLHELPDDPYVGEQWHLENVGQWDGMVDADIDAERAWELVKGEGGVIAVIDSGVDPDHPDLDVVVGYDYVQDDDDSTPDPEDSSHGHGTAAAGLAAALGDNGIGVSGVAQGTTVYGIRLISRLEESESSTNDIGLAFKESVDAGAWVINNSWGYSDCASFDLPASVKSGLRYAEEDGRDGLGTVMVFSAGNDACDNSDEALLSHPTVIGVGAVDDTDDHISYSSYGAGTDIAAPSGAVLTTDIKGDAGYGSYDDDDAYYGSFTGTSAAAPIVAGVAMLMIEANPRLSSEQVRTYLCLTADPIDVEGGEWDAEGNSDWYGCGRVNAGAAVAAVYNDDPGAPAPWTEDGTATEDRVILGWDAASDPDGDRLVYEVSWWVDDGDTTEADAELADTDGLWLDITGEVDLGDVVRWKVRAVDEWGANAESAEAVLSIVEPESVLVDTIEGGGGGGGQKGCSAVGGASGGVLALLGLLGLTRRRTLT